MKRAVHVDHNCNRYFERTETLSMYYDDIRRYDVLSKEEEIELFRKIKYGTPSEAAKARDIIVASNQRFVVAIAKRFGNDDNLLDYINEGNIGLMEAIDAYDLETNNKFISLAVWYIRRAIGMYSINYGSIVKKTNISKTYHTVSKAVSAFIQKEYRQPTLEELADILKNDYGVEINNLRDIMDTVSVSIDANFNNDDEDNFDGTLLDFNSVSAATNSYEKNVQNDFNSLLTTNLLDKLKPVEQQIIKLSFGIGYDREYQMSEISEKVNLTTERVRQLKANALLKLKKEYTTVLKEFDK